MRKTVAINSSHNLRVEPKNFESMAKGYKTYDIIKKRKNIKVGDRIILIEVEGDIDSKATGREIVGEITYLSPLGVKQGYIAIAFKKFSINNRSDIGKFERGRKKGAF